MPSSPPIRMFGVWRGCFRMSVAGDEAEQVADRLNGTMIRGGEAVFNDGWVVIEGQAAAGTKPPRG